MAISNSGRVTPQVVTEVARLVGTPAYLYDEATIVEKCRAVQGMPHAFGLTARYAMKANSSRALLQLITGTGMGLDASSLNEARRARLAGVPYDRMTLTTQETPYGEDRRELEAMLKDGLHYNACSFQQLELVADFAREFKIPLCVRVNPGVGAGETVTRNTGDKYSSFGIYVDHLPKVGAFAREKGLLLKHVHVHIGSGGDPSQWRDNIDRMLSLVEQHFPDAETLNLGGGFKEARMPDETPADIQSLGAYAELRFREFAERTGRKLHMAVEPGTYIVANAGYLVTRVIDKKSTGSEGFDFLVLDGGMESVTRPLLYGSRHPFFVVSREGQLLSSEFALDSGNRDIAPRVVAGRCCESGDSQTLDELGHIVPRPMANPALGDHVVIGGAGAYCSSMTLTNYNSYLQPPEVLLRADGTLQIIRKPQRLEQIVANEASLG